MKFIWLITFTFFLFGCDTLGYIELENKMPYAVCYKTFYNKENTNTNNDISIELDKESKTGIIFGFGHLWNKSTIREYVNTIDSIEISNEKNHISIENKEDMYQFFLNRRKGFRYSKIKIIFEEGKSPF